jgi:hypothetical protein
MNFVQQITVHLGIFFIALSFAAALYSAAVLTYRSLTVISPFTPTQCSVERLLQS